MTVSITNDLLGDFLNCPYKAYLKVAGNSGAISDYEKMQMDQAGSYHPGADHHLLERFGGNGPIGRDLPLDELVKCQHSLATQVYLTKDGLSLRFDALLRTDGPLPSEAATYIPVIFSRSERISRDKKILLAFHALILGTELGKEPALGGILSGREYAYTKIKLGPFLDSAAKALRDLEAIRSGKNLPTLKLNSHCSVCEFQNRCKSAAVAKDDLSLLRGLSETEIHSLNKKGIFTVNQLSYTFRARRRPKRVNQPSNPHSFSLQALALREKKVYLNGAPPVPVPNVSVYFDIEGLPDEDFHYLIGALTVRNGESTFMSFWADSKEEEPSIFARFIESFEKDKDIRFFHFGRYDAEALKTVGRGLNPKLQRSLRHLLESSVNILSIIYPHVYFPTYSNGLKDIGQYLGCRWTRSMSGVDSIVLRKTWEAAADPGLKQRLVQYNQEDCAALRTVTEFISAVASGNSAGHSDLELADDLAPAEPRFRWGQMKFALPDFDLLTKCAYFDYQRDKVFFRTNSNIRAIKRRKRKRTFRINKEVTIRARRCRYCKGTNIVRDETRYHSRPVLDLKITPGCIKRWITRYRTPFHQCKDCDIWFVSPEYWKIERFGHSLVAWSMYQHVANRVTLDMLVRTFNDCFGIKLRVQEFLKIKQLAATRYKGVFDKIRDNIVKGDIVHADETRAPIRLQKGTGYVWTFTNLEEVIYIYKPTRKADFLHAFLQGFRGVLITDFYSGYDSVACTQQKCLVHLTWDLNSALLAEPFDKELQAFCGGFGVLMRQIMVTVEKHGLKSQYLKRHKPSTEKFLDSISDRSLKSEDGERLRKRMLKYRENLFQFLDHDGVPWNNNNAEHAIKYFARYRRTTSGKMSEGGLSSYLLLLSLYQTCEYKGLDFLEFLLSKERDINKFFRSKYSVVMK